MQDTLFIERGFMKKRISIFIYAIFLIFCIGCKNVKNVAFPFVIDYEKDTMPFFEVPLCDKEGESISKNAVRIGLDTGNPSTFLYKSGVESIFDSVAGYYEFGKENGLDIENAVSNTCKKRP